MGTHTLLIVTLIGVPTQRDGFPVATVGKSRAAGITLGDIDGDGRLEILTVAGPAVIAVGPDGDLVPGFPASVRPEGDTSKVAIRAAPLVCKWSGNIAVVAMTTHRRLFAFGARGEVLPGFPVILDGIPRGAPAC